MNLALAVARARFSINSQYMKTIYLISVFIILNLAPEASGARLLLNVISFYSNFL